MSIDASGAMELPEALRRLGGAGDRAYLAPHHLEAAIRLVRLFERAQLRQRVTMSYDPARVGRSTGRVQADMADSAADARRILNDLARHLPPDCWGVLVDACMHERGLQDIETGRQWPRRAAKLVMRIGLDQTATRLGLAENARGRDHTGLRAWLPERPAMFAEPVN